MRLESSYFEFPGAEGRRSLGHIQLEDDRLLLECMSRERLEQGKALLGRCAGRWLSPRGETVQDPGQAMKEAEEREGRTRRAESALPPELEAEFTIQ